MTDHDALCPYVAPPDYRAQPTPCRCEEYAQVRADEAKKWVRQVADSSQRVLDQREELETRVMMLRADQRRRWVDLRAAMEGLPIHEFDEASTHSGYRAIVTREGLCRRDVLGLIEEACK